MNNKKYITFTRNTSKIVIENVGFIRFQRNLVKTNKCTIYKVFVNEDKRHKGFGSDLINSTELFVKRWYPNIKNIMLRCDNNDMFYLKNGFKHCDKNTYIMTKKIK